MKRLGLCAVLVWAVASMLSAQTPTPTTPPLAPSARRPAPAAVPVPAPAAFFQQFCFECHGNSGPEAGLSLEALVARPSIGERAQDWERVAHMLEDKLMPPEDASRFPTDAERAGALSW